MELFQMEKYGFVYIWFDRKHKRYYIGCRWGNENDYYICSSFWMKQGYKHRPKDFKRRILKRVYTNRKELLEEEYRWLKQIKKEELGKRYYNIHNHHFGHWSTCENTKLSIKEKIKTAWTKEKRRKASEQKLGDKNPMKNPDVVKKVRNSLKGKLPWNTGKCLGPQSPELIKRRTTASGLTRRGKKMSNKMREKISKYWKVIAPDGTEEIVHNLNLYCENHKDNLIAYNLRNVAYGTRKSHRNYKCEKL
jgi:hypothetical protein